MWIVRLALRRPYTFVVMSLLIAVSASAKSKVYTNKDLESYENMPSNPGQKLKASKISVDFLDANAYQVLQVIAEVAKKKDGVNIYVSPEIAGKLTIKMTNVPWTEILSVIMQQHNLAESFAGNQTLLIYPKK